jgi:hypothetical protein
LRSFRNGMPKLKASLKKKPVRGRPSAFQVCTMVDPRNAHTVVDFLVHFLGDARNASVFALLFRQTKPTNFRQARTLPKSSVNSNRYSAYAYNSHEIKNSEILRDLLRTLSLDTCLLHTLSSLPRLQSRYNHATVTPQSRYSHPTFTLQSR